VETKYHHCQQNPHDKKPKSIQVKAHRDMKTFGFYNKWRYLAVIRNPTLKAKKQCKIILQILINIIQQRNCAYNKDKKPKYFNFNL
jgi:hypothetical protein